MYTDEEKQKLREEYLKRQAENKTRQEDEYKIAYEKMRNTTQLEKLEKAYNACVLDNIFFKYNEEDYARIGFPNGFVAVFNIVIFVIVLGVAPGYSIITLIICYLISKFTYPNVKKEFYYLKKRCYTHNTELFKQKCEEYENELGVANKIIDCNVASSKVEKILVFDSKKELLYENFIFNGLTCEIINKSNLCSYDDVLRYELIDKTTSQLIGSSSTTSSNAGKALGGAIASGFLLGDGVVGAV